MVNSRLRGGLFGLRVGAAARFTCHLCPLGNETSGDERSPATRIRRHPIESRATAALTLASRSRHIAAAKRNRELKVAIGFKILPRTRKADSATVEKFRKLPVANISDCMFRMTAGGPRLRPMHAGGVMCGPAYTVKCRPGDNLMVHAALNRAEPGDIIVVDAGGDLTNAIIGELMSSYAEKVKIGGFVINGAIRDSGALRAGKFPVYAAGVTHRGPYKDGPGEINVPVAIDGMVIEPGDLIIGDDDGFTCVPFAQLDEVYRASAAKLAAEDVTLAETRAGNVDRKWVEDLLKKLGCEGV
jgi:regulator of RNase E activity RraA